MKLKHSLVRVRASRRRFIPSILATALACALGGKSVHAQTRTWAGATANVVSGQWGTTTNWALLVGDGGRPPSFSWRLSV
jgi:hypothetical protein